MNEQKRKYKAEEWGLLLMAQMVSPEEVFDDKRMDEFLRACHEYYCDAYARERTGLL